MEGTVQKCKLVMLPAVSGSNLWHSPTWIQEVGCSGNGWDDGGHGADVPVLQPSRAEPSWGWGQLLWWGRGPWWVLGVAQARHQLPPLRPTTCLAVGFLESLLTCISDFLSDIELDASILFLQFPQLGRSFLVQCEDDWAWGWATLAARVSSSMGVSEWGTSVGAWTRPVEEYLVYREAY